MARYEDRQLFGIDAHIFVEVLVLLLILFTPLAGAPLWVTLLGVAAWLVWELEML